MGVGDSLCRTYRTAPSLGDMLLRVQCELVFGVFLEGDKKTQIGCVRVCVRGCAIQRPALKFGDVFFHPRAEQTGLSGDKYDN